MTANKDDIVAANKEAWNEAAERHRTHEQFQALLDGFATPGFSVLDATLTGRLQSIGLAGKAVAQLCCNNARELLSVKTLGAARVTGFDFSEAFLAQGRELAAAGNIDAEFEQTEISKISGDYDGRFDITLVTIGVLSWMPDLAEFFGTARRILKPDGTLVVYEQHPILNMYNSLDRRQPPLPEESYFRPEPLRLDDGLDYWNEESYDAQPCYWHFYKTSDIVMSLLRAGFALEDFEELPHNVGDYYGFENQPQQLPLSYVLIGKRTG